MILIKLIQYLRPIKGMAIFSCIIDVKADKILLDIFVQIIIFLLLKIHKIKDLKKNENI